MDSVKYIKDLPDDSIVGDTIMSMDEGLVYTHTGSEWVTVNPCVEMPLPRKPTIEELNAEHPQLKEIWDEYLVMRKLLTGK